MIRSMTGFARRATSELFGQLVWELRTVNHRYLEVTLRVPEELRSAEADFRQLIANTVRRGKVEANLTLRLLGTGQPALDVDEAFLDELIAKSHEVSRRATVRGGSLESPTALDLMRWPGVLREQPRDTASLLPVAGRLLGEALEALTESRESEGRRIADMIGGRARQLEALVAAVRLRIPEVQDRLSTRLKERLSALTLPPEASRERLEQEIALLMTRLDVDEELDRLTSHIAEVTKALGGEDPAGRRLDFLMQEFNREANTLSSKSQDAETTRAAVDMKVLIEQMREQVQNVE